MLIINVFLHACWRASLVYNGENNKLVQSGLRRKTVLRGCLLQDMGSKKSGKTANIKPKMRSQY